jgi:hypothetical protein
MALRRAERGDCATRVSLPRHCIGLIGRHGAHGARCALFTGSVLSFCPYACVCNWPKPPVRRSAAMRLLSGKTRRSISAGGSWRFTGQCSSSPDPCAARRSCETRRARRRSPGAPAGPSHLHRVSALRRAEFRSAAHPHASGDGPGAALGGSGPDQLALEIAILEIASRPPPT